MQLIDILKKRYSTKEFDKDRKISANDLNTIKELLRLSPSSVNLQPWHFVLATSDEGKQKVAESTKGGFAFNEPKILNSSAVVVLCAKNDVDDAYLKQLVDKEDADGRFVQPQFKKDMEAGRKRFVGIHQDQIKDLTAWMDKQVYLNAGALLLGVASLGIDAVPMEGFDNKTLDQVLDLESQGLHSVLVVALGYRSEYDFNSKLPKSRLATTDVVTEI